MKNTPAFPRSMISLNGPFGSSAYSDGYGMDLRDYFAAKALTGLQIWDAVLNGKNTQLANENGANKLAKVAYEVADAMLKAREA